MIARRTVRAVLVLLALTGLLAGCASVVDGTGSTAGSASGAAPSGGFPAQPSGSGTPAPSEPGPSETAITTIPAPSSSSTEPAAFTCPSIDYAYAHLAYSCLTTPMTSLTTDPVWPLVQIQSVEAATGWVLEEGAGHWGAPDGRSLTEIAASVRNQMLKNTAYGDSPTVTTTRSADLDVDGHKAHLVQTTFTLNKAWAATKGTKVKQEKSWIIAIDVGTNDVSLWYTSIPNLRSTLWAHVPAVIKTIKVD